MTAQCSGEVKREVRNVAGKGTARDIVLAVSTPGMVQLSSFQKWRGTEKETKIREKDGQRILWKERLSRPGPFSLEKTLLRKQTRALLKIMNGVGTDRKLCSLPHWYRNYKTPSKFTRWQVQNNGERFLHAMLDKLQSYLLQDPAGSEIFHSSKEDRSQRDIFLRSSKYKGIAPGSRSQHRSVFLLSTSPHLWFGLWMLQNYIVIAVPQSYRFQRRGEMSEKITCRAQHLVPRYQPSDR